MKIVIGTLPDVKKPLERDVCFVKSSSVYASDISFYSPTFLGIEPLIEFNSKNLSEQLFYLAILHRHPFFTQGEVLSQSEKQRRKDKAKEKYEKFLTHMDELSAALEDTPENLTAEIVRIKKSISPYVENVTSIYQETSQKVIRIKELKRASELGLISIKNFSQIPDIYFSESELVESIYNELSESGKFGLLDERFYKSQVDNRGISTRTKVTQIATETISRLPSFENASIDELADIKRELSKYTANFQRAMFEISESVKSEPSNVSFIQDVENEVISKILPAVNEIENAVQENSYLNQLVGNLIKNPLTVPASSGLGLILGNSNIIPTEISAYAATLAGAALISYDAYVAWKKENNRIINNDLFLVHKLKEKISKI